MLLIAVSYIQATWEDFSGEVVHRDQLLTTPIWKRSIIPANIFIFIHHIVVGANKHNKQT